MSVKSLGRLARIALEPKRIPRELLLRWPRASFEARLKWDAMDRPDYAYGTYQAARQARALGLGGMTVIEMGVAGGRGLLALERHARAIQEQVGIEIAIFGFDLGSGLPQPRDYRDMPYVWSREGIERMGEMVPDLRGQLVLENCGHWMQQEAPDRLNAALVGFLDEVHSGVRATA